MKNPAVIIALGSLIVSQLAEGQTQTTNQILSLDGQSGYVTISSAADLQNPDAFTLELWMYPTSTNSGRVMNKGDGQSGESQRSYDVDWNASGIGLVLFFDIQTGLPDYVVTGQIPAPANQWTHIAFTYESGSGDFVSYTNGVLATKANYPGRHMRQTTLPLVFGWTPGTAGTYFGGYEDEIRIWNVARTAQQISQHFGCRLSGTEPGLVGYWNFDNGTANDLTGHGHNGTLLGNASITPMAGNDVIHARCATPCIPYAATATATVVNGFIVGITLTDGGCGYPRGLVAKALGHEPLGRNAMTSRV